MAPPRPRASAPFLAAALLLAAAPLPPPPRGAFLAPRSPRRRAGRRCRVARSGWGGAVDGDLVQVEMDSEEPEALMDLLMGLGACSASAKSPDGEPLLRANPQDQVRWTHARVSAMFQAGTDLDFVARLVRDALDLPELPKWSPEELPDRDWQLHVQKDWKPQDLGRGFQVLLPWHEGPPGGGLLPETGRVAVRLEGGVAFGLGDHPTTNGAAAFLERSVRPGESVVMDYGSGTGILALCAALLGARRSFGVELDAPSLEASQRHVALNGLIGDDDDRAEPRFLQGPADYEEARELAERLAAETGGFDVIVANILREPLEGLAPALARLAKPGAVLGLTGLRGADLERIREAYGPFFEDIRPRELDGGWLLVEARRAR